MKILLTGSTGQLGSELVRCFSRGTTELGTPPLLKEDNELVAADKGLLDITNLSATEQFLARGSFDAVLNCAAYTDVNACESNAELAVRVNALGARNLAIACSESGAKLLHISTDYVFDGAKPTPYTEWDSCSPQSVYGGSKLLGEQYVRQLCPRSFIVRTAWLYGYSGKNFVKTILRLAREKGKLSVVSDQHGNPTNAADLAHHLLKLLPTEQFGTYNATQSGECSWYDFACEIVRLSGITAEVSACTTADYPTPAKRPAHSSLDNLMLRATVGDEFPDWREALERFMRNYSE